MNTIFGRRGWFGAIPGRPARNLRWGLALLAVGVVLFTSAAEARVYYVVKDAAGTGDSWDSALGSITAGLTASASGEEVWVKSATYEEAVSLKTGVALYGGFAGNETSREERDWVANATVIAARQAGSMVRAHDVNSATLDGFVITGGSGHDGSGVYCYYSSPTLTNCTITGNTANYGGGVNCFFVSSPTLTNCTITGNTAGDYGGGVYCGSDSSPTLTNCTITGNTAWLGGGVYCDASSPTLTNCTITGNTADYGGGVSCDEASSPTLTNCTISGNTAIDGGGMHCSDASSPTLTNCIVWNRGAELGGDGLDTAVVRYCSVQGGWSGEGNQEEYPMFVNPDAGDYHLQNGSPCIDRGLVESAPDTDIEGHVRPGGDGLVDIGAYESEDGYTPGTVPPRVLHVRAGAPAGGDGGSWSTAFSSIVTGLSVAGVSDEVWVAAGRYGEAIDLVSGVALYGGFAGNETSREERDWVANETVIDAAGMGRSVVRADYVTSATLDGFVITGGSGGGGGGVYCEDASSPTLTNCTITGNTAMWEGGGVYCRADSSPTLTNCTITGNTAEDRGGGVFFYGQLSSPTLTNCTIAGNTANYGGGVSCMEDSSPTLTNCTITGNTASTGGGVHCSNGSSPTLTNCILWNQGTEISLLYSASCTSSYSNIRGGYAGIGNIDADPGFVQAWDGTSGDFHLLPDSPCVDTGDPALEDGCLPPGLGTVHSDMGAYGGPENCGWLQTRPEPTTTPTPTETLTPTPTPDLPETGIKDWELFE